MAFLLPALLLAAAAAATADEGRLTLKAGCQARCGSVDIPYPFGIGTGCFRNGFEIACNTTGTSSPSPVLAGTSLRVERLSVDPAESMVMLPMGWQCYSDNSTGDTNGNWSDGKTEMNRNGVYWISNTHNKLVVVGCNSVGYTASSRDEGGLYSFSYYAGCMSYCNNSASAQDGLCAGVGCCTVDIPPGLTDSSFNFREYDHSTMLGYSPCDYAFLVDRNNYTFRRSDLMMDKSRTSPVWLDWAIRENGSMSCADAVKTTAAAATEYACKSDHSVCVDSVNGPGYTCKCSDGYEGNAYFLEGCTDIHECEHPDKYPCKGVCKDTQGSYECSCRQGYHSDDPKTQRCTPKFPLAAQLAIGITLAVFLVVVSLLIAVIRFQKRQLFRKNGGKKLENVDSLIFFTKGELKKITKNYTNFLGKGCFGEVYQGTLDDKEKTKVAVKTSVVVDKANVDEFTHEVEIQSKMIHRNVLKLKGCCLEVKRPMLVYEFAANGSLEDIVHGKETRPLSLEQRLDIAIGSAQGLAYMHAHTGSNVIQHGDVKPGNILLDANFVPKMADFGLSKLLAQENQYAELVKGSKRYMDPVYHLTGRLTAASDVYSFGAVLLELISRKPIVYDGEYSLIMEFQRQYEQDNSGCKLFDNEIATQEDIPVMEDICRLAIQCLAREVKDRPDMAKVAARLATLKEEWKHEKTTQGD